MSLTQKLLQGSGLDLKAEEINATRGHDMAAITVDIASRNGETQVLMYLHPDVNMRVKEGKIKPAVIRSCKMFFGKHMPKGVELIEKTKEDGVILKVKGMEDQAFDTLELIIGEPFSRMYTVEYIKDNFLGVLNEELSR